LASVAERSADDTDFVLDIEEAPLSKHPIHSSRGAGATLGSLTTDQACAETVALLG